MNKYLLIFYLGICSHSCGQVKQKKVMTPIAPTNELIHESSPYLLQHAHNPVNWYPWGEKALAKAKAENKMLIISIGYSACHWCHVMEHESFEDEEVARIMNEHFISVKVDREERPDVDQVYMTAAQLITGSGGWPLNAIALADGRPFYAGTYFRKNDWIKMLLYFVDMQKSKPADLEHHAAEVTKGINVSETFTLKKDEKEFSPIGINTQIKNMSRNFDLVKGGFNRAPKFPMPSIWENLLQHYYYTKDKSTLTATSATLDHMANGGIYDHLRGGFARYSTDADWLAPHFEKMLYDNAQLVSLYAHAFQLTTNPLYAKVVTETLGFIQAELTSPEGGFYSALDADIEGEEGKFYVWTKPEIEKVLGKEADVFNAFYDVSSKGNWEGVNILNRKKPLVEVATAFHLTADELQEKINTSKQKLLAERALRIRPGLDDKILTSWNALMLKGYVDAYRALGDKKYLQVALTNAGFLLKNALNKEGGLSRNFKNGRSSIEGLLDDYAFTVSALISLYQATFDEKWLLKADEITTYTIAHFFDPATGLFYYAHNDHANLIARKMEVSDNVIPASNSEMAKNLFILGQYFYKDEYTRMARQMLVNVKEDVQKNTAYYSNWAQLENWFVYPPNVVAIAGEKAVELRQEMDMHYLPGVLFCGGIREGMLPVLKDKVVEGETIIYVCQEKTCKRPVKEAAAALSQLQTQIRD